MSVLVMVELEAAPGKTDELVALVAETLQETRGREGCERLTLHQDQDVPERLVAVERWSARTHHEATRHERTQSDVATRMRALLATRPVIRYYDDVDA